MNTIETFERGSIVKYKYLIGHPVSVAHVEPLSTVRAYFLDAARRYGGATLAGIILERAMQEQRA